MAMTPPSRAEIAEILRGLLTGALSRSEVSRWAEPWVTGNSRVGDKAVWSALELLCAAELISFDRPYLYEAVDFENCLSQLEEGSGQTTG